VTTLSRPILELIHSKWMLLRLLPRPAARCHLRPLLRLLCQTLSRWQPHSASGCASPCLPQLCATRLPGAGPNCLLPIDGMPRRSVQVAAQGKNRVANPEQQARNVLLRKLNIISEKQSPDTEAIKTYDSIFRSPLGSVQRQAVRALFTAHCPAPSVVASDMEP
jgi:hypothetical protein